MIFSNIYLYFFNKMIHDINDMISFIFLDVN